MSNMNKVDDYLTAVKTFYLATTEGNQPKCRPLGFHMLKDGVIYFGIGNFKDVYKQIEVNPNVEICASDNKGFLRLYGEVVFETDYTIAEEALNFMPILKQIYNETTGYKLEIFHLKNATAEFRSMLKAEETFQF